MMPRRADMTAELQLLFDLVSTPSVSGRERAATEVFVRHAAHLGFETEIDAVSNAIAHRGATATNAHTHIMLLGHIDTVPGEIHVRIDNGNLYGRGSVDAKGPLAAMLVAASRAVLPDGVRLTIAGAVGEESAASPGARYLAPQYHPDACFIGEPSGWDGVTLGYKGRLLVTAFANRNLSHSAGPDDSASDRVCQWWCAVEQHLAQRNSQHTSAFDTIQSTIRFMNSTSNGLTENATMQIGFRLPLWMTPEQWQAEIKILNTEGLSLHIEGAELAHATDRNDAVVRSLSGAIRAVDGTPRPKVKTGTADLNVVAPIWRCPIAAYGPGDSALDHTPNEHLSISEYQQSIEVLTKAIESLAQELMADKTAKLDSSVTR